MFIDKHKYNYYFSSWFFSKLVNKFILKGKRYRIEKKFTDFFEFMKTKKNFMFFLFYLEALSILRPVIGAKVWKFSKNKRARRLKKGIKLQVRVKIIPTNTTKVAKFKQALKWMYLRIKKNSLELKKSIFIEILAVVKRKKNSALEDKLSQQNLIVQNRGVRHYRW